MDTADIARTPRPAADRRRVIWLGLDGLDWELLDRLANEGKMPNWKRFVSEGSSGNLRSFYPILSPILWTTAATGVGPDAHRVLDFQEVDPKTGRKIPISGNSREVPAVWNLASAAGRRVGVVGWWASHPAEEVSGFFVSDHASPILFGASTLAGVAYPLSLESGVARVVSSDGRVGPDDLAPFFPAVPRTEIEAALSSGAGMENPFVALSRILAATRVYQRIARDLYDRDPPDLMALYLEGTDEVGHVFSPYVPPRMPCISEEEFRRFSSAVDVYYALVDRILGQWMRRAEEDGAVMVVHSDHGFRWGDDRPCERSSLNWSTAGFWHRLEGVYAFRGRGVPVSRARGGATMFDVAPTVLALLGLPSDRRMSGRPIPAAFERPPGVEKRDVFSSVTVRRVPAQEMTSEQASEYSKKLLALGYLSSGEARPLPAAAAPGDRPGMTEGAWNNLGLYYREERKEPRRAEDAFRKALELRPDYHSPMFNLAVLYRDEKRYDEAEAWLFRSFDAGHSDIEGTVSQWAARFRERGDRAAEKRLLERAASRYPASESIARELALMRFRARDCAGAEDALSRFESATADPDTLNALALFDTCRGKSAEAIALFERSLALKSDQPGVVQSLKMLRRVGQSGGP